MPVEPRKLLSRPAVALTFVLLCAACSGSSLASPSASGASEPVVSSTNLPEPTIGPTESAAGPTESAAGPTESAAEPTDDASLLLGVSKNSEGGHGGPPPILLPAAVVVSYTVRGTCDFSFGFATDATSDGSPSFATKVEGAEISGMWSAIITPGTYYVTIGEAVGCTYSLELRAGPTASPSQ